MSSRRKTIPRSLIREGLTASPTPPKQETRDYQSIRDGPRQQNFARRMSPVDAVETSRGSLRLSQLPVTWKCAPETVFMPAPLNIVRWLRTSGKEAMLAVGSADGGPDADNISLHAVRATSDGIETRTTQKLQHSGKVTDLSMTSDTTAIISSSSDGLIRGVRADEFDETSSVALFDIAAFPNTALHREPAMGVCRNVSPSVATVGASGTVMLADIETCSVTEHIRRGDAIGFRGCSAIDPDGAHEIVTAGASGITGVWDVRSAGRTKSPCQFLRHPNPAATSFGLSVDPSQSHFVMAGTSVGEVVIWDRRSDEFPLNRITLHDGIVWDTRVVTCGKPGLCLTCGEDAKVWLMDFGSAASRSVVGGAAWTWRDQGEYWRSELNESDVVNIAASTGTTLGVNSVDAHPDSDLFAYVSDSATVTIGSLFMHRQLPS